MPPKTRNEYLEQRNALINEAEKLVTVGSAEAFAAKKKEIEDLDAAFEAEAKLSADMNALKNAPPALDVKNMTGAGVAGKAVEDTKADNDADIYNAAFAKYLMDGEMTAAESEAFEIRNAAEGTEKHGAVIPETLVRDIWREIGEMHPVIADTARTFVKGDLSIIKADIEGAADWYDEDTEITDSAVNTGRLTLHGYELAKSVPVTWKLQEMSVSEFLPYIARAIAEVMSNALANAFISGKGVPAEGDTSFKAQPLGIVTALEKEASTPQVGTYTEGDLTYQILTGAVAKIKSGYMSGAVIYAKNKTIWEKLANMMDEIGRPLFVPDVTGGGVGRMFGILVKEEDAIPDDGILIGNIRRGYAVNVQRDISVMTEEYKKKRITDYIGYAIVDGAPVTHKAFSYLKKA